MPKKEQVGVRRKHRGPHHIIPTSRGGGHESGNIYPDERWLPESGKHVYWHTLFINMKPREVIERIREHMDSSGDLEEGFFYLIFSIKESWKRGKKRTIIKTKKKRSKSSRERAWLVVFGDMNGREAIEWIEREFIRKEWLNK